MCKKCKDILKYHDFILANNHTNNDVLKYDIAMLSILFNDINSITKLSTDKKFSRYNMFEYANPYFESIDLLLKKLIETKNKFNIVLSEGDKQVLNRILILFDNEHYKSNKSLQSIASSIAALCK